MPNGQLLSAMVERLEAMEKQFGRHAEAAEQRHTAQQSALQEQIAAEHALLRTARAEAAEHNEAVRAQLLAMEQRHTAEQAALREQLAAEHALRAEHDEAMRARLLAMEQCAADTSAFVEQIVSDLVDFSRESRQHFSEMKDLRAALEGASRAGNRMQFKPRVRVYDTTNDGATVRHIEVECPGVRQDDVQWEEIPGGWRFTIEKVGIDERTVQPVQPLLQECGIWTKDFIYTDARFDLHEEEIILENGVLTIPLRRNDRPRTGRLGRTVVAGSSATRAGTSAAQQMDPLASQCDDMGSQATNAESSFTIVQAASSRMECCDGPEAH